MGPIQALPFVGINIDTVSMSASLPQDKVDKFLNLLEECSSSKSITVLKLQSLCGMLNFACGVLPQARAFSRRLYDLGIGLSKPFYHVKMTKEVKRDIQVWKTFLLSYNSKTLILDYKWISDASIRLYTDASTTIGYGGFLGDKWFYGFWSDQCKILNIAILELYPICLAVNLWGKILANKCLTIHSDNMAVVHIINNNTTKDPTLMCLVRRLVLSCLRSNIFIRSVHIPGKLNVTSDLLSRGKVQEALKYNKRLQQKSQRVATEWSLEQWLTE